MSSEYTIFGTNQIDEIINRHMKKIVERVFESISEKYIEAIILAGGYGRGEGGVEISNGKESLFNDYDLFVISKNISLKKKKYLSNELLRVSKIISEEIDFDVDFSRPIQIQELKKLPKRIMFYELKFGHKVIYGPKDILSKIPEWSIDELEKTEMLKLLLNRGTGLLLTKQKIDDNNKKYEDKQFITRNIFKAMMAAGDALLYLNNLYNYSYVKRRDNFNKINNTEIVKKNNFTEKYAKAMEYKLKPAGVFETNEEIIENYQSAIKSFREIYYYVFSKILKIEADSHNKIIKHIKKTKLYPLKIKNFILNIRDIGIKHFTFNWFTKYPAERLFYLLPYFLFSEEYQIKEVCKALGTKNKDKAELEKMFIKLWERYN